ncbi:MAG TPA: MerR family transcriptional regulator [Sphingomicrobium sp.]|nr:MerR family transcriptional regulator [Sphingomicrobium sp.]
MATGAKDPEAFVTIGELSAQLGVPQHILRYWESKFPQLRPLQRAGNRRYYRPADVALAARIHRLLGTEGYTVRGVQKLLREGGGSPAPAPAPAVSPPPAAPASPPSAAQSFDYGRLIELRDRLAAALAG